MFSIAPLHNVLHHIDVGPSELPLEIRVQLFTNGCWTLFRCSPISFFSPGHSWWLWCWFLLEHSILLEIALEVEYIFRCASVSWIHIGEWLIHVFEIWQTFLTLSRLSRLVVKAGRQDWSSRLVVKVVVKVVVKIVVKIVFKIVVIASPLTCVVLFFDIFRR